MAAGNVAGFRAARQGLAAGCPQPVVNADAQA
jgi:hypothetical protein